MSCPAYLEVVKAEALLPEEWETVSRLSNLLSEGLKCITAHKKQRENWITICLLISPTSNTLPKMNSISETYPFRKILNMTVTSQVHRHFPEVTRKFSDGYNVRYRTSKAGIRFFKEQRSCQSRTEEWSVFFHIVNLQNRQYYGITEETTHRKIT